MSPIERVGTYVSPEEWNELISDPETARSLFNYLASKKRFSQDLVSLFTLGENVSGSD